MSSHVPPRPIQALSADLINQIAAGEVIERPVSIVKELIENSVDAGAGAIKIEVLRGGIDQITVSDDGHGIPALELGLALRQHCTSKITRFEDLDRIVSLGFRGEALASIGAVAEITITSRVAAADTAWSVSTGPRREIGAPVPVGRPPGTTITVRDLFASIPARRQFLRRPQTELIHIQQLLRGVAFCVPGVAFSLRYDDHRQWTAAAARDERSNLERWRAVFGAAFARDALYVDVAASGIRLFGWVGPAKIARNQADLQVLAVNGRLIRDRQLAHAIRLAFGSDLGPSQFATYALHIEVAPDDVDVNVHPSKAEVRFRRIRDVHDLIYAAIRQLLSPTAISADAPYESLRSTAHFQVAEQARPVSIVQPSGPTRPESQALYELVIVADRFLIQAGEVPQICDLQRFVEAQLAANSQPPSTRVLLFPVRLGAKTALRWSHFSAEASAWGFEASEVGPDLWVLRGVPAYLPEFALAVFATVLASDPTASSALRTAVASAVCRSLQIPPVAARLGWFLAWCDAALTQGVRVPLVRLSPVALAQLCVSSAR